MASALTAIGASEVCQALAMKNVLWWGREHGRDSERDPRDQQPRGRVPDRHKASDRFEREYERERRRDGDRKAGDRTRDLERGERERDRDRDRWVSATYEFHWNVSGGVCRLLLASFLCNWLYAWIRCLMHAVISILECLCIA